METSKNYRVRVMVLPLLNRFCNTELTPARDGEEYNLIGSTENVEARLTDIRRDSLAYLNIDVAVVGDIFRAAASPVLEPVLLHVLERVVDPHNNKTLRSIFAEQNSKVHGLDAGK